MKTGEEVVASHCKSLYYERLDEPFSLAGGEEIPSYDYLSSNVRVHPSRFSRLLDPPLQTADAICFAHRHARHQFSESAREPYLKTTRASSHLRS